MKSRVNNHGQLCIIMVYQHTCQPPDITAYIMLINHPESCEETHSHLENIVISKVPLFLSVC